MSQQAKDSLQCKLCDATENLVYTIVAREPITPESAPEYDPLIFCEDHYTELAEGDEYYVRELVPVPEERGGFDRTSDDQGMDILYDHNLSQDAWVRFDPEKDELNLTEG